MQKFAIFLIYHFHQHLYGGGGGGGGGESNSILGMQSPSHRKGNNDVYLLYSNE